MIVELGRVILSDTRCYYNLFSRTIVKKKKENSAVICRANGLGIH